MQTTQITITELGTVARQIIPLASEARIWGFTSRGVFLHLLPDWMIFISSESAKGPLILNSNGEPLPLRELKPGLLGKVWDGNLHFATLDLTIRIDRAAVWSVPKRADVSPATLAMRFERLDSICRQVLMAHDWSPSDEFLSDLMEVVLPGGASEAGHRSHARLDWRFPLSDWNLKGDTSLISALDQILGLGAGLTPAGDDLALGYLLVLNRWGDLLFPGLEVREINTPIRQAAYRKTTLLSANLIECASLGLADERLILALDGIMTGVPPPRICASCLLNWGNSSGASALIGMALAVMSG